MWLFTSHRRSHISRSLAIDLLASHVQSFAFALVYFISSTFVFVLLVSFKNQIDAQEMSIKWVRKECHKTKSHLSIACETAFIQLHLQDSWEHWLLLIEAFRAKLLSHIFRIDENIDYQSCNHLYISSLSIFRRFSDYYLIWSRLVLIITQWTLARTLRND